MSTPAPEQAPAKEQKFNPHDFPQELRDAQRLAAKLYAELHAFQARLPWSREPDSGWPEVTERGRERAGRDASPGWPEDDAKAYDKLWADLREATAAVQGHGWWGTCRANGVEGADMVAARQALKSAKGAVPLSREDVEQTA